MRVIQHRPLSPNRGVCMGRRRKPRILLYSHDTYGLGHLRRSMAIADRIARDIPGAYQLLLTGSMVAGAYQTPPRFDMVKLPALSKRSSGAYTPRTVPLSLGDTISWREQIILQAALNFEPDLLLVDKAPAGVCGELLPTLRHLRTWSPRTRLVFGMRDIEDAPEATIAQWEKIDANHLFTDIYDAILLYGSRTVFDPVTQYALPQRAADKVIEVGYLGRSKPKHNTGWVRRKLDLPDDRPLILVTVGGGGDGFKILETFLHMVQTWSNAPFHPVLVTGPLMARRERQTLERLNRTVGATLFEFTPDLIDYMVEADLVVSMAGYNTTVELLSLGKRAILIPRSRVRAEQSIRAAELDRRGLAHHLPAEALTPERLREAIVAALDQPAPRIGLPLDGLAAVANEINVMVKATRDRPGIAAQPSHAAPQTLTALMQGSPSRR